MPPVYPHNTFTGYQNPGTSGEFALESVPQIFDCLMNAYTKEVCEDNTADWRDTNLFKRNIDTAWRRFYRAEHTEFRSDWTEITGNENWKASPASMYTIDLPEQRSRRFTNQLVVTSTLLKWQNSPYTNSVRDYVKGGITQIMRDWDRFATAVLWSVYKDGEKATDGTLYTAAPGQVMQTPVGSANGLVPFFSPVATGLAYANLYVGATSEVAPIDPSSKNLIAGSAPLATNELIDQATLKGALKMWKMNQSVDYFTGETGGCCGNAVTLYMNCFDELEMYSSFAPGYPVENPEFRILDYPDTLVRVVKTQWVDHRQFYLIGGNHDVFFGEVTPLNTVYKQASLYMPNEHKNYYEFDIEIMFGVFTRQGIVKGYF